mgnify:CR=1 FL=1
MRTLIWLGAGLLLLFLPFQYFWETYQWRKWQKGTDSIWSLHYLTTFLLWIPLWLLLAAALPVNTATQWTLFFGSIAGILSFWTAAQRTHAVQGIYQLHLMLTIFAVLLFILNAPQMQITNVLRLFTWLFLLAFLTILGCANTHRFTCRSPMLCSSCSRGCLWYLPFPRRGESLHASIALPDFPCATAGCSLRAVTCKKAKLFLN